MRLTEVSAVSAAEAIAQRIKATINIVSCSHACASNCGLLPLRATVKAVAISAPFIALLTPFCHPLSRSHPGIEACARYAPEPQQLRLQEGHHGAPQNLLQW